MCLIVFAYKVHPKYKLILAANRDEFYARPTSQANWWKDHSTLLGGRDLMANGTWMGINRNGRFAAVTNYRDLKNIRPDARSRGDLPTQFLIGSSQEKDYAQEVFAAGQEYNGFNLLVMEEEMFHVSNYDDKVNELSPGIYGLSNALLETPWPKVQWAKQKLKRVIDQPFDHAGLIAMMQDDRLANDEDLPETGLDYQREKALSAMCIQTPDYGTCCTTAITVGYDGVVQFTEKSYPVGDRQDQTLSYSFQIEK